MKLFRDPNWTLIFLFLGILIIIPLVQTIKEAIGEDTDGIVALHLFQQPPTAANLRAFEENLESGSWASKLSTPWFQFAQFKWLNDGGEKVAIGEAGWYFYKPGLTYMLARPELVDSFQATNDPVAAIVHFKEQLSSRGIKLLLVPVPNKESVYPDRLSGRAAHLRGMLAPRTKSLMEHLQARGVEVLDLFSLYGEARTTGSPPELYLQQDTHWSPIGVSMAAKATANRLLKLGWVNTGTTTYNEKPTPVKRTGDLIQMLRSPQITTSIPPEAVDAVQVTQADGALYQDHPEAEVLVIGDSFLRIYQQDEPTSAGFIAHLAQELKQPLMSLVNDGGGATLVREELANQPILLSTKKVVIWEFVERDFGLGVKGWPRVSLPSAPGHTESLTIK